MDVRAAFGFRLSAFGFWLLASGLRLSGLGLRRGLGQLTRVPRSGGQKPEATLLHLCHREGTVPCASTGTGQGPRTGDRFAVCSAV